MNKDGLHLAAFILVIIGGLNWLLQGVFGWEVGALALGGMDTMISRALYVLVGLSAIYLAATHNWGGSKSGMVK